MSKTHQIRLVRYGLLLFAAAAFAEGPVSIWDGVYTTEQAGQGEISYRLNCASCHGEELEGRGQTPPLTGEDFTGHWDGTALTELFEKMQSSMPADRPGKLDRDENAAILAYMLKYGKVPAGQKTLSSKADELARIRFDEKASRK